jgi:hypothetical protein
VGLGPSIPNVAIVHPDILPTSFSGHQIHCDSRPSPTAFEDSGKPANARDLS